MSGLVSDDLRRVLVVDDEIQAARSIVRFLDKVGGYQATFLEDLDQFEDAASLVEYAAPQFDALICDHVLQAGSQVRFTGAEVVSRANLRPTQPLPAVLITSHYGTDQTGTIPYFRSGIPAWVPKGADLKQINQALHDALDEIRGVKPRWRRTFTTPIEVIGVSPDGEAPTASVVVVGWQIDQEIPMPLRLIIEATGLEPQALPGVWLEADVNCHARFADELFYENITIAPPLADELAQEGRRDA